ncbi:MAG: hypothetical protein KJ597_07150, partial [Nanoarchaeota archaeon]|nr:hypothetical protein [Nanoarchaeota archaeon]
TPKDLSWNPEARMMKKRRDLRCEEKAEKNVRESMKEEESEVILVCAMKWEDCITGFSEQSLM